MKENERQGTVPKKVGYLKYLRLHREEVKPTDDMLYRLDDELAFMKKISAERAFVFFNSPAAFHLQPYRQE